VDDGLLCDLRETVNAQGLGVFPNVRRGKADHMNGAAAGRALIVKIRVVRR
jgi:hypothetical protein